MLTELLKSALVLVVSFAVKWIASELKIEIDEALFNTVVAAIVVYLLGLFGVEAARSFAPKRFK